jgi:hypothetical protein
MPTKGGDDHGSPSNFYAKISRVRIWVNFEWTLCEEMMDADRKQGKNAA